MILINQRTIAATAPVVLTPSDRLVPDFPGPWRWHHTFGREVALAREDAQFITQDIADPQRSGLILSGDTGSICGIALPVILLVVELIVVGNPETKRYGSAATDASTYALLDKQQQPGGAMG